MSESSRENLGGTLRVRRLMCSAYSGKGEGDVIARSLRRQKRKMPIDENHDGGNTAARIEGKGVISIVLTHSVGASHGTTALREPLQVKKCAPIANYNLHTTH